MIIETKHNVGDTVMFIYNDKIFSGSVLAFYFNSGALDAEDLKNMGVKDRLTIASTLGLTYKVQVADREIYFPEYKLFKTREEVLESL